MSNYEGTFQGQRIVVTGGAGFIGSNLVRGLLETGAVVTVLDDFFTGREANLPRETSGRLDVIRGSVTDLDLLRKLTRNTHAVFHLAARNIIVSTRSPREDCDVNIGGTLNVLLAARENGVRRVVYSSSASVYGNPRYLPINEDDSISLLNPYAVSKFAGEGYCRALYEMGGVSAAVVRYSNVYGPGQQPGNPYCGVVAKLFASSARGERPNIHGDGRQTRDFTYVDDVVEATLMAGASPKAENQVYNVSTGFETSVMELCQAILAISGGGEPPLHVDRRDIDNIRRRVLNIEKIRRELRWTPQVSLEDGLKKTWEWMRSSGTPGAGA